MNERLIQLGDVRAAQVLTIVVKRLSNMEENVSCGDSETLATLEELRTTQRGIVGSQFFHADVRHHHYGDIAIDRAMIMLQRYVDSGEFFKSSEEAIKDWEEKILDHGDMEWCLFSLIFDIEEAIGAIVSQLNHPSTTMFETWQAGIQDTHSQIEPVVNSSVLRPDIPYPILLPDIPYVVINSVVRKSPMLRIQQFGQPGREEGPVLDLP